MLSKAWAVSMRSGHFPLFVWHLVGLWRLGFRRHFSFGGQCFNEIGGHADNSLVLLVDGDHVVVVIEQDLGDRAAQVLFHIISVLAAGDIVVVGVHDQRR